MNKNIIGTFKGRKVYKITLPEYVNGRYYHNEDGIFLIDGELIYKNEVFATYDGMVHEFDIHRRRTFYTIPKIQAKEGTITIKGKHGEEDRDYVFNFISGKIYERNTKTADFEPKDVDATLAGVYETDYFSSMTDIDNFLAEAIK